MRNYLKILHYARKAYPLLALSFISLLLYNVFNTLSLTMVIPFLEILFSSVQTPQTQGWKQIFYQFLYEQIQQVGRWNALIYFCIAVFVGIFLKNLFRYLSNYFLAPFEQRIVASLREQLFQKLQQLPLQFFTHHRKGKLMNLIINDVQIIQEGVVGTLYPLLSDPITMLFFFITMLVISWKLTLFTLIVLPLTGYFINRIARSLKQQAKQAQRVLDRLLATVDEAISGIRIIRAFNAETYEQQKHHRFNERYFRTMVRFRRRTDLASPLTEVLSILVVLAILLYGGYLILKKQGELKPSEFIGFIALFSQFLMPIKTLSAAIARIQKAMASFQRIEQLLQTPNDPTLLKGTKKAPPLRKAIRIENVSFAYNNTWILKNISLTIYKGEKVAIVGPSGSGKTTLLNLIARFYDPQHGQLWWDDIPYTDLNVHSLRNHFGIVTQEGFLFNDTIRNNIAYGAAKASMEQIIQAARIANAHDFIMELPQQYDTYVGEQGLRLSGGQRQRIAIARAVLRNPSVLLLDEATSALDAVSEQLVHDALQKMLKDKTAIIIAHRLSTIQNADRIIVMQDGRIVEQGNHQQLLQQKGLYYHLYHSQTQIA